VVVILEAVNIEPTVFAVGYSGTFTDGHLANATQYSVRCRTSFLLSLTAGDIETVYFAMEGYPSGTGAEIVAGSDFGPIIIEVWEA